MHGHHVYTSCWTPAIGKKWVTRIYDRFAVVTSRGGSTVGHLPIKFSKVAWYFLHHGGHIVCEITGNRQRSSVLSKGLVVPCIYTFSGKLNMVKKLIEEKKITS